MCVCVCVCLCACIREREREREKEREEEGEREGGREIERGTTRFSHGCPKDFLKVLVVNSSLHGHHRQTVL